MSRRLVFLCTILKTISEIIQRHSSALFFAHLSFIFWQVAVPSLPFLLFMYGPVIYCWKNCVSVSMPLSVGISLSSSSCAAAGNVEKRRIYFSNFPLFFILFVIRLMR
jgi:hypothetical protein